MLDLELTIEGLISICLVNVVCMCVVVCVVQPASAEQCYYTEEH